MLKIISILSVLLLITPSHGTGFQEIQGVNGGQLVAEIVAVSDDKENLILRGTSGELLGIKFDQIAEEDKVRIINSKQIEQWQSAFQASLKELNSTKGKSKFKIQFTGNMSGSVANLKVQASTSKSEPRENPCQTVWYLLSEDEKGGRSIEVALVPFQSEGMDDKDILFYKKYDDDSDLRSKIHEISILPTAVDGAMVRRFEASPWPATATSSSGSGAGRTFDGGWKRKYTLNGKATSQKNLVLAWRVEVWQGGKMKGAYDYPSEAYSSVKGVPKYWWIYNRYPNDINYGRR